MHCLFRLILCFQIFLVTLLSPLQAGDPIAWVTRVVKWPTKRPIPPHAPKDEVVERLARNIDWLEREIDRWGTVVAKSPDVWGEARLTKYRREIEEQLEKEVGAFDENRISGTNVITDRAMIAAALALQGANPDGVTIPSSSVSAATFKVDTAGDPASVTAQLTGNFAAFNDNDIAIASELQLEQVQQLDQLNRYLNHLAELRRINEGDDTADAPGYALNLVRIPTSILPGTKSKEGYGAELTASITPYLGSELLPIAFRDFVINDLVDQLSLPLTRFLNGDPQKAKEALKYIEEVEKLAKLNQRLAYQGCLNVSSDVQSEISALLDKNAFRFFDTEELCFRGDIPARKESVERFRWEVNTLLSQVESLVTPQERQLAQKISQMQVEFPGMVQRPPSHPAFTLEPFSFPSAQQPSETEWVIPSETGQNECLFDALDAQSKETVREFYNRTHPVAPPVEPPVSFEDLLLGDRLPVPEKATPENKTALSKAALELANRTKEKLIVSQALQTTILELKEITLAAEAVDFSSEIIPVIHLPGSTRRASLPFPPTQLLDVYGQLNMGYVALQAWQAFQADILNRDIVHVSDVQAFLREELGAAYDLMMTERMRDLWEQEAMGQSLLYQAIRGGDQALIDQFRDRLTQQLSPEIRTAPSGSLAWAIFVESVLLNERLLQDIRETAGTRPGMCPAPDWNAFYGPSPCEEARIVFAEYVRHRWPLRVFALDPVITEQNIADKSSIYRQMQIAVAMSFAAGDIGLSAALQAQRRLQRDQATIDLNRVAVGFAHGDNTCGWRFYPRFQTAPVEGNLTVLFRDLIAGGPTDRQLECSKQIEPGMRECLALVLMPSFVPHVTIETRGNWFKLTKPSHTQVSIANNVEYSRTIQTIRREAQQSVRCADLYRNGEVERMIARVDQLARELPLQTLQVPIPIENSLGGFEILSSGQRELAPELLGWYGAPGYDPEQNVSLFLSGDNFSVHQTRLIVGNHSIPFRMLSRQIMEVTLPPGLPVLRDKNLIADNRVPEFYDGYVDAHIATPYGVSGHLLIPVVRRSLASATRYPTVVPNTIRLRATRNATGVNQLVFEGDAGQALSLVQIDIPSAVGLEQFSSFELTLVSGDDRLKAVSVPLAFSPQGQRLFATGTDTQRLLGGDLLQSIKPYLDYLFSRDENQTSVTLQMSGAIKRADQLVACRGGSQIVISIDPKPSS